MRRILKWFLALFTIGMVCLLAVGLLFFQFFRWSIPESHGSQLIAGLDAKVTIVRDAESVPHINAKTLNDAAKALGFVHAQERLWQMHVLRMAGQGRLSELFGKATLDTDIFLKTLDMATPARESFATLNPETKLYLQAYADGVNAYLSRETHMFDPGLPPEFLILGVDPEPWKPWHSSVILKVMDLSLGANMDQEIKRFSLASKGYSPAEIDDLILYGPRDNPPPLPDLRDLFGIGTNIETLGSDNNGSKSTKTANAFYDLDFEIGITSSNNWVISGDRTKSGKPILANDPHLGFTAPAIFYLAHLSFEEGQNTKNIIGGSLPGTPLILVGRNDRVAWGLTTTYLDSQDLYIERIDPDNKDQYLTPTGPKLFESSPVTVAVSGGDDVVITRRTTRHGPVLPVRYKNIGEVLPPGHVAALRWTALDSDDTTMNSVTKFMLADSVNEFIGTFKDHVSPMQSIVVADTSGNIGLIAPGRVPVRSPFNKIEGRAPSPGWAAQYDWEGFLPFDQLPKFYNPAGGAIATANANYMDPNYTGHITHDWAEHFRQARVEDLIVKTNQSHDIAMTLEAMADRYSPALVKIRDLAIDTMPAGVTFDPALIRALRNWDGNMDADKPEPLLMVAWFRHLHKNLLKDDLDEIYELFKKGDATVVINIIENAGARNWCDDTATSKIEDCAAIFVSSLNAAISEVEELQGNDWKQWRWGKAHKAFGEHRPFAQVGPLAGLFNVTVESSGGPYTLLRGQTDFGKDNPFLSRHGSVYRAIYDFDNLENSKFIQSTGQSGHFMSGSYSNFAQRWADMEFIPMTTDPKVYNKGAIGIWTLEPAN